MSLITCGEPYIYLEIGLGCLIYIYIYILFFLLSLFIFILNASNMIGGVVYKCLLTFLLQLFCSLGEKRGTFRVKGWGAVVVVVCSIKLHVLVGVNSELSCTGTYMIVHK